MTPKNLKKIAEHLKKMAHEDQLMRREHQNPDNKQKISHEEFSKMDRERAERLKKIVGEIGWPTWSKVGKEASYGAWLIVQHADFDVLFQKKCLQLMQQAYDEHDLYPQNVAYLYDRVAVNTGEKQKFGTQFELNDKGELIPVPIENEFELDKRRKEMDLEEFEIYRLKMQGKYKWPGNYSNPQIGKLQKVS